MAQIDVVAEKTANAIDKKWETRVAKMVHQHSDDLHHEHDCPSVEDAHVGAKPQACVSAGSGDSSCDLKQALHKLPMSELVARLKAH
eukprot:7367675-Lingulodinium_polyedra.AAC.1